MENNTITIITTNTKVCGTKNIKMKNETLTELEELVLNNLKSLSKKELLKCPAGTLVVNFLEKKGAIRVTEDNIFNTEKYSSVKDIKFEEFWDVFPVKTPSGRKLRPTNKEWGGNLTYDYTTAEKKYLTAVKSLEIHKQVCKIVEAKNKNATAEERGYENNIITYINQKKWERDSEYLKKQQDINRM